MYVWEIKENLGIYPIFEWEIVLKKWHKYKAGDKYCNLCMDEKHTIASYNNRNE